MYYIYDTSNKRPVTQYTTEFYQTAKRWANKQNIVNCGVDETDKPEEDRRYIVKEA